MNGIWIQRKWNESIPQLGRGHASIENMSVCTLTNLFYLVTSFLTLSWVEKLTEKTENSSMEDDILTICIKEIYLLNPWLPFQRTKLINRIYWSSFHTNRVTASLRSTLLLEINTVWDFFLSMPLARRDSGCFSMSQRYDEITFMIRHDASGKHWENIMIHLSVSPIIPGVNHSCNYWLWSIFH